VTGAARGVAVDAPVIVTERLELWLPAKDDIRAMWEIVADPATRRFLPPSQTPAAHFERYCRNAGSWLLYGYGSFMVRERGGGAVIGNIGVFHSVRGLGEDFDDAPEAGWVLRADRVGRGFAREAMEAVLAWFEREHGRLRIVCMIAPDNAPSIVLAGRLGFSPVREAQMPDGETVRLFERVPDRG
jgi:RimJ/RimL family protein N-acetyltransferase